MKRCLRIRDLKVFLIISPIMRLDCVLTAVNENQLYLDFIPFFIDCWKALYPGVQTRVILIANEIPDRFHKYAENIILFPPIKDVSTAFTSQYIRILYPALLSEFTGGIMITDIDDMPMNRIFFTENMEAIPDDRWINMRDWRTHDQICCCWQIATQKTWMEVFKIADTSEIIARIKGVSSQVNYADTHGGDGWFTDQQDLFKYVMIQDSIDSIAPTMLMLSVPAIKSFMMPSAEGNSPTIMRYDHTRHLRP